jgi:hypothetical protein
MVRFTIRELVLLTIIVAMGAAWWVDRSRVQSRLTKELEWRATLLPVDASPGNELLGGAPAHTNGITRRKLTRVQCPAGNGGVFYALHDS